ncbi:MAG: cytochrome c-type biogenesis protein CcmH [Chloroflexi bacterium]|nr:cytochrome c-type biogenesis protein CcmH [Chloroflexota bacterium]
MEEAQRIDRMLMCPVCPGQTIDQARVEISRQMRRVVREMLTEGASREQILQFFVDRYGTGVLAAPPKSGVNLVVWIVPVAGGLAALGAALLVIRSMTGPRSGEPAEDLAFEDGLDPYLDVIDRDLAPDLVNDARPEVRRDRGS